MQRSQDGMEQARSEHVANAHGNGLARTKPTFTYLLPMFP
jgi:hypothetical protein